ncbi:zeta toxin family protein [Saccharopolyspora shandongensis]|uniref:zeta toxin family protein n=1 Tax=Saccharopolyspora shandongensis TaxID=418495 RepID=UPI0033E2613A
MSAPDGPDPYVLAPAEVDRIFTEVALPTLTGPAREHPVAVWVGGQGGSGKTTAQGAILDALGHRHFQLKTASTS